MLQLLHLVQLINNKSIKTNSIVIHLQKALVQLVVEFQELNFTIYFNLVLKYWRMFNLKKQKKNELKTINTIQLISHLRKKIHFNNLPNQYLNKSQYLNKLCPFSRNKCKILNLIIMFLFSINKLLHKYQ